MENPIDKIMQTRYKIVFIGLIIALIVFAIGALTVAELGSIIQDQQIDSVDFVVQEKYIENNQQFYIIKSDQNETFNILNDEDGTNLFNKIEVGKHYRFIVQHKPGDATTQIIQVYNEKN